MAKKIIIMLLVIAITVGCSKKAMKELSGKPSSGGKTLEVMLVVPQSIYKGELADTLGVYFANQCEGLNQPEPSFDLVRIEPAGFFKSEMFQKHRNIIIISMNDTNHNKLYKYTDYKAIPQNYFEFSVTNRDSLYALIRRSAPLIRENFYANEYKRIGNAFKDLENVKATNAIKSSFGFTLVVSEDFYIATEKDNFIWIRKEMSESSMGLMIYKTDFKPSLLDESHIIETRNNLTHYNIAGPSQGSYMGVETRFPLVRTNVTLDNKVDAVETRGLWRLLYEPDAKITAFMGGAFVNYCFESPDGKSLIMIDGFVYSPKTSKRDLLLQLEAVVRNIKF
ncbi:MAG: DUF4837 family protein [Bacteroidales bacterium]|jgi:hypothetical protein|nr:DUF4837 family protein [Bacteroidales bacterium]